MQDFRLKVFRTVAGKLNFTNAAEVLFLTQPAVTLQIKTLEEDLGVKLFDRSGGKVRLTEAGDVLLGYAERIADLYNEAESAVGLLTGEERGELAIGASTTIAQYVLPALLGEFLSYQPRVELSMVSGNTENIIRALDEKRITLGLVEGPIGRNDLKTNRFIEDEIVAVVAADHKLATAKDSKINLKQLAEMPQIWREHGSGTRRVIEDTLKKAKLKLRDFNIAMELDSTEAIKSAVKANLGIGFISRWALSGDIESGLLKIISINKLQIKRQFKFVYPRTPPLEGSAETFLRFALRRRPILVER